MSFLREYCCCASICCFCKCCRPVREYLDARGEAEDDDAVGLTHVADAAYQKLRTKYWWFHHKLWNVTSGQLVAVDHTPRQAFTEETVEDHHSDWFAVKLGDLIANTEIFCDVTSLGPPDGEFLVQFKRALKELDEKDKPITVRMLFGNVLGMPVNCNAVIAQLTEGIDSSKTKLRLWVGAWRKGVSWNHSKIIAVDGNILHTGGHNLWDHHYLKQDPVHDLSVEVHGRVAHDGHLYANGQWTFVEIMQRTCMGFIVDKLPDGMFMPLKTRVTVSEFPVGVAGTYPPKYVKGLVPRVFPGRNVKWVPMITMGRYGKLVATGFRPSDTAIVAMIDSANTIVRLALQDLGPVCIPSTKVTLPGCMWPKSYLNALGRALWTKGVDIEVVVSNPLSIPGGLKLTDACYGNGWTCVDVAAEIVKTIREQFPKAQDADLRKKVTENLRVCFLRGKRGQKWEDGMTMGLHSKHFIIDDMCTYVGSQNLYICDLAEWGTVIDGSEATEKVMEEFWNPLWEVSYRKEDCDVQAVMDGLKINRDGEDPHHLSPETQKLMDSAEDKRGSNMLKAGRAAGSVMVMNQGGDMDCYYASDKEETST